MEKQSFFVSWTDQNGENIARAFNISEEREKELDDHMDKCYEEGENYAETVSKFSEQCNTAEELAYGAFFLGMFVENLRAKHQTQQKLKNILGID